MMCVKGSEVDDSSEIVLLVQGQCLPVAPVSLHCTPEVRVKISKTCIRIGQGKYTYNSISSKMKKLPN